jgi:biopolymer transport protein TolQ
MPTTQDMSMLSLVLNASLPVQFIMLLLIGISVVSWTFIFAKRATIKKSLIQTRRFEDDFWSGGDLALLHQSISTRRAEQGALARIFDSGMTEFLKARRSGNAADVNGTMDGARRAMRAACQRELDELESH